MKTKGIGPYIVLDYLNFKVANYMCYSKATKSVLIFVGVDPCHELVGSR